LGTLSIKGISDLAGMTGAKSAVDGSSEALNQAQKRLLRSKGFVWMATSSAAAYFMSHAGQASFGQFNYFSSINLNIYLSICSSVS
jgi:hypothetical protein